MSLRYEQERALLMARELLADLITKPQRLLVRSVVRQRAASALKHYPLLEESGKPIWSQDDFALPKDPIKG